MPSWENVLKILLDKGLLALVLLTFGWVLNRSIERFRSLLAFGGEVLKQRLSLARQLVGELHDLREAHFQFTGGLAMGRMSQETISDLLRAASKVDRTNSEARLVLSAKSTDAVKVVRERAVGAIVDMQKLAASPDRITVDENGETHVKPLLVETQAALQREWNGVRTEIDAAIQQLYSEFPDISRIYQTAGY